MADKSKATAEDEKFMAMAVEEAKKGYAEGGIPIGAVLVSSTGSVLGRGHNKRIQNSSATLHAEISCLENAGRLPASVYRGCTMYTTLSPCPMCTGACILYNIPRVVIGENENFVGAEDWLKHKGVELVFVDSQESGECKALLKRFGEEKPGEWGEDIGVDT